MWIKKKKKTKNSDSGNERGGNGMAEFYFFQHFLYFSGFLEYECNLL